MSTKTTTIFSGPESDSSADLSADLSESETVSESELDKPRRGTRRRPLKKAKVGDDDLDMDLHMDLQMDQRDLQKERTMTSALPRAKRRTPQRAARRGGSSQVVAWDSETSETSSSETESSDDEYKGDDDGGVSSEASAEEEEDVTAAAGGGGYQEARPQNTARHHHSHHSCSSASGTTSLTTAFRTLTAAPSPVTLVGPSSSTTASGQSISMQTQSTSPMEIIEISSDSETENQDTNSTTSAAPVVGTVRDRTKAQQTREKNERARIHKHHPELADLWDKLEVDYPVVKADNSTKPPEGLMVKLLPFQLEGLSWLLKQENSKFNGGILADEMGMGKTISWHAELTNRTAPGSFNKIVVYHGAQREGTASELSQCDIVLTTYAILESMWRKQTSGFTRKGQKVKEDSVLHAVHWGRVVCDEAHAFKDRSSNTARAIFNLKCDKKWSLSGTPLQNRVGELYSQIRFLSIHPFSYYFCSSCDCKSQSWDFSDRRVCDHCGHKPMQHFCWWNKEILKPIQKYGYAGEGKIAFEKLGKLLDRIMLRRTKIEKADDLGLPPRVVVVRRDYFNQAEEELYESLYSDSKRIFNTYVREETVLNNYANIFELLMKMRQAANHPDLVLTRLKLNDVGKETLVCGICQEVAEDPIMSKCKHVFCREDAQQYISSSVSASPACPVCHKALTIDLGQDTVELGENETLASKFNLKASIINNIDLSQWRSSTKIEALVEELTMLQKQDATIKSIVFSQFVNFLDLVHWRLKRGGFNCVKLDGRMSPAQRDTVIKTFMEDPTVTVFLVSLKAGGVALTLTEASRVFLCDPWWNGSVEDQAFDRIHRLGQYRPIQITRLIIENSIESRIIQLQEKKKMLFESTVGKDMTALTRLTEDDLRFLFVL